MENVVPETHLLLSVCVRSLGCHLLQAVAVCNPTPSWSQPVSSCFPRVHSLFICLLSEAVGLEQVAGVLGQAVEVLLFFLFSGCPSYSNYFLSLHLMRREIFFFYFIFF